MTVLTRDRRATAPQAHSVFLPRFAATISLWRDAWIEARQLERQAQDRYPFFGEW